MSFPPGTEMFQFPGFASISYVFRYRSSFEGVAPFGYPRIKACSRLPMAFRSVPRPSSPPDAKASTECSYRALSRKVRIQQSAFSRQRRRPQPTHCPTSHHAQKQNTQDSCQLSGDSCQVVRPVELTRSTLLSITTPLIVVAAVLEPRACTHGHPVRLANRSTPRDAPEPDLQLKDQQRSSHTPEGTLQRNAERHGQPNPRSRGLANYDRTLSSP